MKSEEVKLGQQVKCFEVTDDHAKFLIGFDGTIKEILDKPFDDGCYICVGEPNREDDGFWFKAQELELVKGENSHE